MVAVRQSFDPSADLSDVDAADLDPVATYDDPGEVLYYEISNIPDGARIVDGTDLIGKTGAELSAAIASADLIGRVVGDTIQLTVKQAAMAHLVVASDADLTESNIDLKAFTREPLTGEQSTQEGTETATVEITAVADKPILSADEGLLTRGLVDVRYGDTSGAQYLGELGLTDKAQISIPATVSLEDLDGSESLWVWVTPYAYDSDGVLSPDPTPAGSLFLIPVIWRMTGTDTSMQTT